MQKDLECFRFLYWDRMVCPFLPEYHQHTYICARLQKKLGNGLDYMDFSSAFLTAHTEIWPAARIREVIKFLSTKYKNRSN